MSTTIVDQKLNKYADIIETKEYKDAEKLVKDTAKLIDFVKEYCQEEKITLIKTDKYLLKFNLRTRYAFGQKQVPDEIYEKYKKESKTWVKNIINIEDIE